MITLLQSCTAYVDTWLEAIEAAHIDGVEAVVVENAAERAKMLKLLKGTGPGK